MKTQAARAAADLSGAAGVYLFCGQESFLRRLYRHRLIDAVLGRDEQARLAVADFDGGAAALADVLDELRTLPFLAPRRVVIVHDADPFITAHRQALENYQKAPCPTGVLVLLADKSQANTNLYKAVAARGGLVACDRLSSADLAGWIRARAKDAYAKTVDYETASLLADLVGDDLDRLDNELAKLAVYLGDERKVIAADDVDELVANRRMHEAFELTGAIAAQDARAALARWEDMLAKDRDVEYTAVGLLAWQLRQLIRARLLRRSGLSRDDIFRRLRLPYHVRDRFAEQVGHFSEKRLRKLVGELVSLDVSAKTGGAPPARSIEQFIITACQPPLPAGRGGANATPRDGTGGMLAGRRMQDPAR